MSLRPYLSLLIIILLYMPSASKGQNNQPLLLHDVYNLEVTASQWQFQVIDLNAVTSLVHNGSSEDSAREQFTYLTTFGRFQSGKVINFTLYSIDVQHGFSLVAYTASNESILVQEAFIRPFGDQVKSDPVFVSIEIPEHIDRLSIECYIFCGLGHPDMKFDLLVDSNTLNTTLNSLDVGFAIMLISTITIAFIRKNLIENLSKSKIRQS